MRAQVEVAGRWRPAHRRRREGRRRSRPLMVAPERWESSGGGPAPGRVVVGGRRACEPGGRSGRRRARDGERCQEWRCGRASKVSATRGAGAWESARGGMAGATGRPRSGSSGGEVGRARASCAGARSGGSSAGEPGSDGGGLDGVAPANDHAGATEGAGRGRGSAGRCRAGSRGQGAGEAPTVVEPGRVSPCSGGCRTRLGRAWPGRR